MMMRFLVCFLAVLISASGASAHIGHLGDLAGHSHWLALGAGVAAAGLAAILGRKKKPHLQDQEDATENSNENTNENMGEDADELGGETELAGA